MAGDLHDIKAAIEFYDERYEQGYMEEWDDSKKRKVEEIIHSLNLPQKGTALDFGCGNGVFTNIIKNCLPQWEVYGVEISDIAVKNAKKKFPLCNFFSSTQALEYSHYFDFLFSHHVLEHVQDMNETLADIDAYLKPDSSQLHIFPCGNEGSYEYNICKLHKDGIESSNGNRFFFEEPGHLRRLTSSEFIKLLSAKGFILAQEYYANQVFGAINWITKSSPRFVKKLTNPRNGISAEASQKLRKLRKHLLLLTYKQFPYSKYWMIKSKWNKKTSDKLSMLLLGIPALICKNVYDKYETLAQKEWEQRKTEKNGSEMYLYFQRINNT